MRRAPVSPFKSGDAGKSPEHFVFIHVRTAEMSPNWRIQLLLPSPSHLHKVYFGSPSPSVYDLCLYWQALNSMSDPSFTSTCTRPLSTIVTVISCLCALFLPAYAHILSLPNTHLPIYAPSVRHPCPWHALISFATRGTSCAVGWASDEVFYLVVAVDYACILHLS